jgi:hypothetical protein
MIRLFFRPKQETKKKKGEKTPQEKKKKIFQNITHDKSCQFP